MVRASIALGVLLVLLDMSQSPEVRAQNVGSWRNSPPQSKAIIHDEKGRRLYWDANGQIVGRYSYHTGKYTAVLPGEQREEIDSAPEPRLEDERSRNPHKLAIVYWGQGRGLSSNGRSTRGPKIISGNFPTSPIVRHTRGEEPLPAVAQSDSPAGNATISLKPMGIP